MQPPESLNSNENTRESSNETIPPFNASAPYNGMYKSKAEADGWREIFRATATESSTTQEAVEGEVIDVEAREVFVNPDSLDDTDDIAELIANNDELTVGTEKLALTPQLKKVAEGVLSSLDMLLGSEPELPEEIDWRHYIMAEPDYDESYDYILLHKLLNAQYKRKRAKLGAGKLLESTRATWSSEENDSPPEQTTEVATETPQLGYEAVPEGNQDLPDQKQITQH